MISFIYLIDITEISGLSVMDHGVSNFSIFKNFNQFPINKDNTELFKIQKDHKTSEAEKQKNSGRILSENDSICDKLNFFRFFRRV